MYRNFIKRTIDISLAIIALPILIFITIIVSPFIILTDKGPIFYNAKRIGKNGELYKMYKFRSMLVNAPDIRLPDGSTYNGEDDPRVTKIGRFLRKTSLDEIPQILNVLIGDMSLIGPRPDPPDWIDKYPDDVRVFLSVRPGITGYSQAYFRNSVDSQEKMKHDVYYAHNCSFSLDVKVFFKTILVVLKRENTYKDTPTEMLINANNEQRGKEYGE
jgi:undecaprenyl phosphate N,N'-diacetylbacillosamine 1-phosphate transferase